MANRIFFSIIIPTYNRESLVLRAIESVRAQKFADFELLIIDDGSTDETETSVGAIRDSRVRYKKIENSERGAARNVGIRLSKGNFVTFLDSDDYLYPDHLQFVYAQLALLDFPEMYHQGYVIINSAGKILQKPYRRIDVGEALFTKGNIMSCMGVFVRRDIIMNNPFEESRVLAGLEDWELWVRLAAKFSIHYHPRITSALVQHGGRSSVQINRSKLEAGCKLFMELVSRNAVVNQTHGIYLPRLFGNIYTYLSLHLSEDPDAKRIAWLNLVKGVKSDKRQIFRKRTVAILRNLLIT